MVYATESVWAAGDKINKGHVDEMAIVEKIDRKLRTRHKGVYME